MKKTSYSLKAKAACTSDLQGILRFKGFPLRPPSPLNKNKFLVSATFLSIGMNGDRTYCSSFLFPSLYMEFSERTIPVLVDG